MRATTFALGVALSAMLSNQRLGAQQSPIPVQLGVSISPDTVTVGERFIVVIRVRAPRGTTVDLPIGSDSASASTATQLVGKPVIQRLSDSVGTTASGAYRLVAWDIGPQALGLGDIVVRLGGETAYVPLTGRSVFVRSVLPADSALRVPKPPRQKIALLPFNWMPLLIAAIVIALATLLWRIWIWYRRRGAASLDPFSAAERDFKRVEALELIGNGEPGHHAALMSDVMREYLAARIPRIERSHTSSELLAHASDIHGEARGLGELLWRTDLIKFANNPIEADEGERLGQSARDVVRAVETLLIDRAREQARAA